MTTHTDNYGVLSGTINIKLLTFICINELYINWFIFFNFLIFLLTDWMTDYLSDLLTDALTDWPTDWLMEYYNYDYINV